MLHSRWPYGTRGSAALTNLICRDVVSKISYILTGTGIPNDISHFISIKINFIGGLNLVSVCVFFNIKGKVRCVLGRFLYI